MNTVDEESYFAPLKRKGRKKKGLGFYSLNLPEELLEKYDLKENDWVEIFSCGEVILVRKPTEKSREVLENIEFLDTKYSYFPFITRKYKSPRMVVIEEEEK